MTADEVSDLTAWQPQEVAGRQSSQLRATNTAIAKLCMIQAVDAIERALGTGHLLIGCQLYTHACQLYTRTVPFRDSLSVRGMILTH